MLQYAKRTLQLAVGIAVVAVLGCFRGHTPEVSKPMLTQAPQGAEVVVWLALDGVRWQEIFWGTDARLARDQGVPDDLVRSASRLVPNLSRLAADGMAVGAPGQGPGLFHSGPNHVSLPGYVEMLQGRRPNECTENDCRPPRELSVADAFALRNPGRLTGVFSSWDRIGWIEHQAAERVVVSTGRKPVPSALSGDADQRRGHDVALQSDPYPGHGPYRADAHTANLAGHFLYRHRPSFLFIALGDTDEHAHAGDYRRYLEALIEADRRVGELRRILEKIAPERHVLWVTTDHGRAIDFTSHGRDPESSRVWLIAAGRGIPSVGTLPTEYRYTLSNQAPTLLALVGHEGALPGSAEPIAEVLRASRAQVASTTKPVGNRYQDVADPLPEPRYGVASCEGRQRDGSVSLRSSVAMGLDP